MQRATFSEKSTHLPYLLSRRVVLASGDGQKEKQQRSPSPVLEYRWLARILTGPRDPPAPSLARAISKLHDSGNKVRNFSATATNNVGGARHRTGTTLTGAMEELAVNEREVSEYWLSD